MEMEAESITKITASNITKILLVVGISLALLLFIPLIFQGIDIFNKSFLAGTSSLLIASFSDFLSIILFIFVLVLLNVIILLAIFLFAIWIGTVITKKFGIVIIRTKKQLIGRIIMQIGGFALGFFLYSYSFLPLLIANPIVVLLGGTFGQMGGIVLNYFNILANILFVPILISYGFVFLNDVIFYLYRKITKKKIVEVDSGEYSYSVPKKSKPKKKMNKWLKVTMIIGLIVAILFIGKIFLRPNVTVRFRISDTFFIDNMNATDTSINIVNTSIAVFAYSSELLDLTSPGSFFYPEAVFYEVYNADPQLLKGTIATFNIPKNYVMIILFAFYVQWNLTEPLQSSNYFVGVNNGVMNYESGSIDIVWDSVYRQTATTQFLSKTITLHSVTLGFAISGGGNIYDKGEWANATSTVSENFNLIDMLLYS